MASPSPGTGQGGQVLPGRRCQHCVEACLWQGCGGPELCPLKQPPTPAPPQPLAFASTLSSEMSALTARGRLGGALLLALDLKVLHELMALA